MRIFPEREVEFFSGKDADEVMDTIRRNLVEANSLQELWCYRKPFAGRINNPRTFQLSIRPSTFRIAAVFYGEVGPCSEGCRIHGKVTYSRGVRIFIPCIFVFFILAAFWALMNGKLLYAILFPALVAGNFAMMRGYIWYNWNELENLIRSKVI